MTRSFSRFLPAALAVLTLSAQQPVAMVADLSGSATLEGTGPLGITMEVAPQQAVVVGPGGRLVLIQMATGEQLVFLGPCKVRFDAQGRPVGDRPAESKPVPMLQRGLTPVRLAHLAQAGLVMRERQRPDRAPRPEVLEETPTLDVELEKLRPEPDAPFEDRVVFATLVAQVGRPGQARPLWRALAKERPGDAALKALAER